MGRMKELSFAQRERMREALYERRVRSLPCLNSNNSIHGAAIEKVEPAQTPLMLAKAEEEKIQLNQFSTSHKKSAYVLEQNVKGFIDHFGIDHVGFLTLTFADHVTDAKEAQRRFNSLRTNFLKHHYPHYIRVVERTKSGRIHYHLIVACKENIRIGLNFSQIAAKDYRSANMYIRQHWERLRTNLHKYGFGRAELLPVKTNSKGLAKYVAKYIGKHINSRLAEDKGIRLCQTSIDKAQRWKRANCHFQFLSQGSREWRNKLAAWVDNLNDYLTYKYADIPNKKHQRITESDYHTRLSQILTPKWAFINRDAIMGMAI